MVAVEIGQFRIGRMERRGHAHDPVNILEIRLIRAVRDTELI
jgi:hypothetical protein